MAVATHRYITLSTMQHLLRDLGDSTVSEDQLAAMLLRIDTNHDGVIGFAEFFDFVAMQDSSTGHAFHDADITHFTFGLLDRAGKGYVTVAALLKALASVGAFVQVDELSRLMSVFGHHGRLKLAHFAKLMNEHNRFGDWIV